MSSYLQQTQQFQQGQQGQSDLEFYQQQQQQANQLTPYQGGSVNKTGSFGLFGPGIAQSAANYVKDPFGKQASLGMFGQAPADRAQTAQAWMQTQNPQEQMLMDALARQQSQGFGLAQAAGGFGGVSPGAALQQAVNSGQQGGLQAMQQISAVRLQQQQAMEQMLAQEMLARQSQNEQQNLAMAGQEQTFNEINAGMAQNEADLAAQREAATYGAIGTGISAVATAGSQQPQQTSPGAANMIAQSFGRYK